MEINQTNNNEGNVNNAISVEGTVTQNVKREESQFTLSEARLLADTILANPRYVSRNIPYIAWAIHQLCNMVEAKS